MTTSSNGNASVTKNGAQAMDIMKRLNGETGTAFVFAIHDFRMVFFARRVVKLHDSQIVDGNATGMD